MAVSHLEREFNLTIELALESLKSVEPSMKDKEKAGQIETAQRASDKNFMKRYHRGRLGHFSLYSFEWLDNTWKEEYTLKKIRTHDPLEQVGALGDVQEQLSLTLQNM
ncbi:hypothetical protein MMC29_004075 [Sticta canariensis]|nr:hypothetical protein [Sticta canariensis]